MFERKKLNLNPSKKRYMIFNAKTKETALVKIKIGKENLQRVWKEGKETCFKLVGIEVGEDLSRNNHIQVIRRKINSALYGLAKTGRDRDPKKKKLMYSRLIHSHLVYSLPIRKVWQNKCSEN